MTDNKKIKELLLQVIELLDEPERDFLTYEEAKEKSDNVHWYDEGIYRYKIDNKWTLVENEVKLIEGVDDVWWYQKGVYEYEIDSKYTLVEDGVKLVEDVDELYRYEKGVYNYEIEGKWYEINLNK